MWQHHTKKETLEGHSSPHLPAKEFTPTFQPHRAGFKSKP